MGLLQPTVLAEKSFGIHGQAVSTKTFNAQEQGYLANAAEMVDATSTKKHLIVSVWANNWSAGSNTGAFEIEFASSKWATYEKDWEKPVKAIQASAPDVPMALATKIQFYIISLINLYYFII